MILEEDIIVKHHRSLQQYATQSCTGCADVPAAHLAKKNFLQS